MTVDHTNAIPSGAKLPPGGDKKRLISIGVCVILNMLDGFDILAMSFTASGISTDLHLSGGKLGMLFSAGLVGMVLGSLFVAPLADRVGRRTVVLACIPVASAAMGLSALSHQVASLAASRLITGMASGAILACANVLVSENSSARWRTPATAVFTFGYSLGATLGGAAAGPLIGQYGWRAVFVLGAIATMTLLPIAYWNLRESDVFCAEGAARPASVRVSPFNAVQRLLDHAHARRTILLWCAFFSAMTAHYFVFSWTPRLLTRGGLTAAQGINGGVILNVGAMFGTVLFGLAGASTRARKLAFGSLLAATTLMGLLPLVVGHNALAFWAIAALGTASTCALACFYVLTPSLYESYLRSSGMGWGLGIGRIGAILSPLGAGLLVDRGWGSGHLYWLFAGAFIAAALAVIRIPATGAGRLTAD